MCWRNQCETVQLLTLALDFIAPALWPAKSPDLNPVLDYKICKGKLPDSWRWPAEVAPDQEWEYFHQVFINEAVSGVHFDSHMSVWLAVVDIYVFGWSH